MHACICFYMLIWSYLPIVYTFVYVAHMYRCMRLEVHPQSNGKWGRHHCSINLEGDACERKLLNASLVHKLQPGTGEGPDLKDFTVTINDGKGNHPNITWFRVGEVGEIWFRQIGAWFFSGETGTSTHSCLAGRCGCRSTYSKCPNYIFHWNSWVGPSNIPWRTMSLDLAILTGKSSGGVNEMFLNAPSLSIPWWLNG